MLALHQIFPHLHQGDWMCAIDLQDTYFHIPVSIKHRKFLRFQVAFQHFQFRILPFGLKSAPRTFSKCMAVVAAFLRKQKIFIYPYLDDWLLKSSTPSLLQSHLSYCLRILNSLGLQVHYKKSVFNPENPLPGRFTRRHKSKRVSFGGEVIINKEQMSCFPQLSPSYSQTSVFTAGVNGLLYLLCSQCQAEHAASTTVPGRSVDADVRMLGGPCVSTPICQRLHQMVDETITPKRSSFHQDALTQTIVTDASLQGWGAHMGQLQVQGLWLEAERGYHINLLELKAVHPALKSLYQSLQSSSLLIQTDSTTTVLSEQAGGWGTCRGLSQESQTIWKWLLARNLNIVAIHLPGA